MPHLKLVLDTKRRLAGMTASVKENKALGRTKQMGLLLLVLVELVVFRGFFLYVKKIYIEGI